MKTYFTFFLLVFAILLTTGRALAQSEVQKYLDKYYGTYGKYKVYLHTDKSIYARGERIWISGLLLDRKSHQPVKGQNYIDINIVDVDGNKLMAKAVPFKDGKAGTSMIIPDLKAGGNFYVRASMNKLTSVVFEKEITILDNAIPYFIIDVSYQNKFYAAGDEIRMLFRVTDYYNNPIKKVKYELKLNSNEEVIHSESGKTDSEGKAILAVKLPNPLPEGDLILYNFFQKGIGEETVVMQLPVKHDGINIDFYPESGALTEGLENKMMIKARDNYGRPFPFEGKILDENDQIISQIKSDDMGIVKLKVSPSGNQMMKLQVVKPYAIEKTYSFPEVRSKGLIFNYEYTNDDSIKLNFKNNYTSPKLFKISNIYRGDVIFTETITFSGDFTKFIGTDLLKNGVNQITIFDSENKPVAEQKIFKRSGNRLQAQTEEEHYDNRSKVNVLINHEDSPLLTLSVKDEFRISNDLPTQNIISFLNIDSETHDHIVYNANTLIEPALNEKVNDYLQISNPSVSWKDIYSFNERIIDFGSLNKSLNYDPLKTNLFLKGKSDEYTVMTNFDHSTFYLASNPKLLERLDERAKEEKNTPYYKELLRSGGSILDAIYSIKQFDIVGGKIVFPGTYNSLMAQGGALIVIDGVRLGENISVLNNLNPFSVDEIFVSTKPIDITKYTGLNSVGIVEITTKRGEKPVDNTVEETDEFEAPDYENNPEEMKNKDDIRTTIHWEPFFKPENKPQDFYFFHSDIRTKVIGVVEGIDENGDPVYDEFSYESFDYSRQNQ